MDLPSTVAGGGQDGRKAAFVPDARGSGCAQQSAEGGILRAVGPTRGGRRVCEREAHQWTHPANASFHEGGLLREMTPLASIANGGDPVTPLCGRTPGPGQGSRVGRAWRASRCTSSTWAECRGRVTCTLPIRTSGRAGSGPSEKIDLNIAGGAGGAAKIPGDYYYGDLKRHFTEAGMWGLFRVLPNTCSTGGISGLCASGKRRPACQMTTFPVTVTALSSGFGYWFTFSSSACNLRHLDDTVNYSRDAGDLFRQPVQRQD